MTLLTNCHKREVGISWLCHSQGSIPPRGLWGFPLWSHRCTQRGCSNGCSRQNTWHCPVNDPWTWQFPGVHELLRNISKDPHWPLKDSDKAWGIWVSTNHVHKCHFWWTTRHAFALLQVMESYPNFSSGNHSYLTLSLCGLDANEPFSSSMDERAPGKENWYIPSFQLLWLYHGLEPNQNQAVKQKYRTSMEFLEKKYSFFHWDCKQ